VGWIDASGDTEFVAMGFEDASGQFLMQDDGMLPYIMLSLLS